MFATAPVVSPEALETLRPEVDQVLCVQCPDSFMAVGTWYSDFSQTTDEEVGHLLADARHFARQTRSTP